MPRPESPDSRYPRLTVRLPQWLLSSLKDQAVVEGTTTADLVRAAVIGHLDACHAIGNQPPDQAPAPLGVVITA